MSKKQLKTPSNRRLYSEEFKQEAVATYEASGKSAAEICRLLDISCGSLLRKWCKQYGSNKSSLKRETSMPKMPQSSSSTDSSNIKSSSEEADRIIALEGEIKRLKQVLANQAVKDYLAELREESWREMTSEATLKEVEKRVSKKL